MINLIQFETDAWVSKAPRTGDIWPPPPPTTPDITIDWRHLESTPEIKVSLIDVSIPLVNIWSNNGHNGTRGMGGQYDKLYLLSDQLFKFLIAKHGDGDTQREQIFNMYIKLLKLNMSLYQQVTSVFGLEKVQTELDQWFLEQPTVDDVWKSHAFEDRHYYRDRLEYLWAIPDKCTSPLLTNHKQYVLDLLLFQDGYSVDSIFKQMSDVLCMVLEDAQNHDINQRWLINMLEKTYTIDPSFRLLQPFIQPIDQCLRFFHLLDTSNMNTIITRMGPSFKQYYKHCEQLIVGTLEKGLEELILLQGIAKFLGVSFGSKNNEEDCGAILELYSWTTAQHQHLCLSGQVLSRQRNGSNIEDTGTGT
ncbi:hypothetical protein SAMD00019534_097200 [Acytostelium subglobosum LB1]|uniref:hypothetical protein n=1 Tax=Acytostelium subglobosum LB1 TaxID=1410327 RepID=UPI0006449A99|nr:hypothetical protein SAMD00019534_097200 [Acytostelium subglobosum LB1]GAM26545.1 hypothetical protein SAMD00019534_097200 [Acytostelium subglobosum LB1]|eukprot:XP_012750641.1 hypothetical protein SAMD00019534_097200 [Acytostelium subglobosum LB1]